jgi:Zn-finger nucleic acid-binding protein
MPPTNCTNCGASLTPVADRHYLCCAHCTSFYFLKPLEESADGVVHLHQVRDTRCPVCDVNLTLGSLERREVQFCERCRGILLCCGDFSEIVQLRRARETGVETPTPLDPEELKRVIRCPVCQRKMETHPYHGPGAVVIDSCRWCAVLWVDHGEIAQIVKAPGRRG